MATYYVRPDGNNANSGTGPATNQAWQTIQKALGATGIGSGDTVYIAPGLYGEQVTIGGTYSATTYITGDPTASQFSGLSAGRVQIGAFSNLGTAALYTGNTISGTSKNNLYFSSIEFLLSCGSSLSTYGISLQTSQNNTFDKCIFQQTNNAGAHILNTSPPTSSALNLTVKNCVFIGSTVSTVGYLVVIIGQNVVSDTTSFINTIFQNHNTGMYLDTTTMSITNCTFVGLIKGLEQVGSRILTLKNSLFLGCSIGAQFTSSSSGTQTFCRYVGCGTSFSGASASATSSVVGTSGVENYYTLMNGLANLQPVSSIFGSPNTAFGTASGAPVADLYGVTWTGATPDAGAATYRSLSGIGQYNPTERNASTITIAPGSTSQSIELYLGVVGLTTSSSGLSARYNRTRTASVSIPLVARTIAQAWTAGGFAEVDATNMPGVYRLDIPDAALAAGADDVTLVVRGASGTNGAVMTVKLSSGGLTSAQTASAVWGATVAGYNTATDFGGVVNETRSVVGSTEAYVLDVPNQVWNELTSTHTTHGTFGWNILRADQQSKQGLVTLHSSGGINRVDADVHAIVNDTDAAIELKGALLHNGTDYISAELLSPTSPATTLRMGPYSVVADQTKQEINVDILTGASLPVVLQLVDANGTGIPLTGATLSVKIYTTSGTLVTTYTGTASYADAGFVTFTLTSAVTATPGTYYVTVTRSSGATDTSIYGGLRLYVRSN